jgi:phage-related protein (TIGR01555 family)
MSKRTTDGYDNFVSRIGLNNENTLSAGTYRYNLVTRNRVLLEMAYRGSWIVGRVVDSVATDMTRSGIVITTSKGNDDLKKIDSTISRLKINQSLCSGIKWGRLYGGAIGVVQIEGQDLSTPLNLDSIDKDQFKGIAIYDRWQVNPAVEKLIDSGPDFGLPAFYEIVSDPRQVEPTYAQAINSVQNVHHSRIIRFSGIDLPYFQAITEMMWGESVLERLWDRLIAFDNASLSAASLIDRANLRMIGIEGLRDIIAGGGQAYEGLLQMFDMIRSLQTNEGFTLLDKNDEFQAVSYSFAGLSDMLLQYAQQLSGSAEIPLVVLMSQSPVGLNSNADSDVRIYYDSVRAQQESKLRNAWELLLKVLWRSTFGKPMPDDLEFQFVPLWQMTETEKAANSKTIAETIIGAYENDVIDKPTAMKELRDKSGDTGLFSNITDEQIAEAQEQVDNPPLSGEIDPATGQVAGMPPHNPNDPAKTPVKSLDAKAKSPAQRIKEWLLDSKA